MSKPGCVRDRPIPMLVVAIVGATLAGCGSTRSGGMADASRGGAGGAISGMGGASPGGTSGVATGGGPGGSDAGTGAGGAGGRPTGGAGGPDQSSGGRGDGGCAVGAGGAGVGGSAGAGETGAGGAATMDAGICPPGQVWCPGCTPGTGSCGPTCVGLVCPGPDGGASDVPIGLDSGNGGAGSGGRGTGGAGGAGEVGAGGITSSGGRGGSGGAGGATCSRVSGDDALCSSRNYPPVAYFCPMPAGPPSTACVSYNGIGSGDFYCCPDQSVSCPDEPPADASACSGTLTCRYGTHPDLSCRIRATCSNGSWQVSSPPSRCGDVLPGAGCPATPANGVDCSPDGLECYYPTGDYCICAQCTREYPACIFDDPIIWHCLAPPGDGCPTYYPNLGSTCALPANTQCRYRCDLIALCNAEWVWVDVGDKCPICNSPETPIATPAGNRPIASLVPGDLVYSVHRGRVSVVPIAEVGRSQAPRDHQVMRVVLETGTVLQISPRHPTADGRTMRDLVADDRLDGVPIVSATLVPYRHSHTYDILPSSDTGTYYAGGALIGSTMAPAPRLAVALVPACAVR
jgi:hypothetical protein